MLNTIPNNISLFVNEITQLGISLVDRYQGTNVAPVIMIDGLAGCGKSTFSQYLYNNLRDKNINVVLLGQDNFGMDRAVRNNCNIHPCSDIARDFRRTPAALEKLIQKQPAYIPRYNKRLGSRTKTVDQMDQLQPGDLIVYEGISCLSSVILDNHHFTLQKFVEVKIFFQPENEQALYQAKEHRELTERNGDPLKFAATWQISRKNNWLYTMRGRVKANYIVTRSQNCSFNITYLQQVSSHNSINYRLLSPNESKIKINQMLQQRQHILKSNLKQWFTTETASKNYPFVDETALMFGKKSFMHDKRFNNRLKLSAENTFAAIIYDNVDFIKDHVKHVTSNILKYINRQTTPAVLKFFIEPFAVESGELGRSNISFSEKINLENWLFKKLQEDITKDTLAIHMRFHIRFSHFINEMPENITNNNVQLSTNEIAITKLTYAKLRNKNLFEGNRGRKIIASNPPLTRTFGTLEHLDQIMEPFAGLLGSRYLQPHIAAKSRISVIGVKPTNKQIVNFRNLATLHDRPIISSISGAMLHLLSAAKPFLQEVNDIKYYHLAALCHIIVGGHHTLYECLTISQELLKFTSANYDALIPNEMSMHFSQFLSYTNQLNINNLWEISDTAYMNARL